MSAREDIVRGVRFGFILLAGLLVVYAAFRVLREPAGAIESRAPNPVVKPHAPPAHLPVPSKNGPSIPPPPPRAGKPVSARKAPIPVTQTIPVIERAGLEEEVAAAAGKPPEPAAAAKEEEKQTSLQTDEIRETSRPADDAPARPETRGRRVIKAVGRFLHLGGRKDSTWDSIRQQ